MRTLTPEEIMMALKRKPQPVADEKPDMTYAEAESRLEPSTMPTGQGEIK